MKENNLDKDGISVGLTFIVLGAIIQFVFLNYELALWIATLLIGIGIAAVGLGIEKTPHGKGFDSIGVGVLFILPSFLSILKFPNIWIRIIVLLPLMLGIFGIFSGIIKQIEIKRNKPKTEGKSFLNTRLSIELLFSCVGLISNIVTIIAFF